MVAKFKLVRTIMLKNGIKINDVFKIVRESKRNKSSKPIILMGYYNMIYQLGENKFLIECKKSKVDGLIVVDLPLARK